MNERRLGSTTRSGAPVEIEISVVVPVYNEAASILPLLEEIEAALDPLGRAYEMILVDDGSTDTTWEELRRARLRWPRLVAVRLTVNRGQTPALMAGFDASRGKIVVTLDGDLQNDPADIPRLLTKLEEGYEIVSGWRRDRQDRLLSRRFPSVVANAISRRLTGITIHDNGCALKAYRGEVLRAVSLYSEFHRFIVPLAQMGGARVGEIVTNHRARRFGRSKYGLGRVTRVAADLATLYMLTRYSHKLLVWFLLFAAPMFGLAVVFAVWSSHIVRGTLGGPLLVPVAGTVLLFQSALAITGYGLFAERIRFLAPNRRRTGARLLATVRDDRGEEAVLIRGADLAPLGARRSSSDGARDR